MLKDVLQTLFSRTVLVPIGIITGILTARFLGPSDRGLFTLLLILPQTAAVFSSLGLDSASIYLHRKHGAPLGALLVNCLLWAAGGGVFIAGMLWLARDLVLGALFSDASMAAYVLSIASVPLLLLFQYLGGLARAAGRFDISNARAVIEKVLFLAAVASIFFVFGWGVVACLAAHLVILLVICAWMMWDMRFMYRDAFLGDRQLFRRMLAFGVKTYGQAISSHLHYKADLYLIAAYLGNADIAFYAIGAGLAERLLMMPDALGVVLFPRLSSESQPDAARLAARACRNTFFLGGTTALILAVFGGPVVGLLYGVEYLPAVRPMYVLLAGVVMVGVTRVLMRYFTSVNRHEHNVYIVATSLVVNVILNLVLIPRFGIMGAAAASLATYVLQGVWVLILFTRITGTGLRETLVVGAADAKYVMKLATKGRAHLRPARSSAPL